MNRTCPNCNLRLVRQHFKNVEIDVCSQCAGIFFEDHELSQIRRHGIEALEELDFRFTAQEQPDAFASETHHLCPACRLTMTQYRYLYSSAIMLDACPSCSGLWIEEGELRAMASYLRAQDEETPATVVAVMQSASIENVSRAREAARSMRDLSRHIPRM